MQDAQEERLKMLFELARNERNFRKFLELVHEINLLIAAKHNRSTGDDNRH